MKKHMMSKKQKNPMIEAAKAFRKQLDREVCNIYAAFCIALHNEIGLTEEQIRILFSMTQEIWHTAEEEGINMNELCIKETGINIMYGLEQPADEKWEDAK